VKDLQDRIEKLKEKNSNYRNKISEGFRGTTAWRMGAQGTPIYSKEEDTRLFGDPICPSEKPGLLVDVYTYFEDDEKILDEMCTKLGGVS
jgi:hypothetical protein